MYYRTFIIGLALLLAAQPVTAAMTSTNYQIGWDDLNAGGGEDGTSTNYGLHDTLGDIGAGGSSSTNYQLSAGYRAPEAENTLALTFKGQSTASKTAYTSFSAGSKTVTVASAASFSVGIHIAVVENEGFSQKVTVGKVVDITGGVMTVDAWSGDQSSMSASPTGENDYVYALTSSSAAFGSISAAIENTAVAMTAVESRVTSGYTVYVQANQVLQSSTGNPITNVLDGAVTLGSEEYGLSVTGTRAVGAGVDQAVTTTQRIIQSSGGVTGSVPDRVAETYKLAVTSATPSGVYGHTIFYTLTANF